MQIETPFLAFATLLLAAPAFAGDAAVGEALFAQCRACHSVIAPDGTEYQKGGRTGPNLHGLMGRAVGAEPGFNYGAALVAVGAAGVRWDEAALTGYLLDPTGWVRQVTGDSSARSTMTVTLAEGAADIAAYLSAVSR